MDLKDLNLRKLKKPSPKDIEEAVSDFIGSWCLYCDIGRMTDINVDLSTLRIPCPESTRDTCPILNRIKAYHKKEEDYYAAIRPTDKDADSGASGLQD